MIECPNCKHQELPGALFCSECGAQLVNVSELITHKFEGDITDKVAQALQAAPQAPMPPATDVAVSLYIIESGEVLPLEGKPEYTLGRSIEGQPLVPDVDLASFHAYENGVSRIHASLTLGKQHAILTDLGSANGTRLNGLKLTPHESYPIKHGDILTLGRLKIQLLIRR